MRTVPKWVTPKKNFEKNEKKMKKSEKNDFYPNIFFSKVAQLGLIELGNPATVQTRI